MVAKEDLNDDLDEESRAREKTVRAAVAFCIVIVLWTLVEGAYTGPAAIIKFGWQTDGETAEDAPTFDRQWFPPDRMIELKDAGVSENRVYEEAFRR